MVLHQPLELEYWFWNVFSGSISVFFFIFLAVVVGLAAKFRMGAAALGIMIAMFMMFFGQYYMPLYILGVIVFVLAIVPVFNRIINRN